MFAKRILKQKFKIAQRFYALKMALFLSVNYIKVTHSECQMGMSLSQLSKIIQEFQCKRSLEIGTLPQSY